jgi:integrase
MLWTSVPLVSLRLALVMLSGMPGRWCCTFLLLSRSCMTSAFTQAQAASPLARRPYDFRYAGVSWRLNAGTSAPLVAEWAGHTVEVLLRIYAHCIDGDDERWFGPMEQALSRG